MRINSIMTLTVLTFLLSAGTVTAKSRKNIESPASDSRIEYTGRTLTEGTDVSFDWSGTYVRVRFNGP